MIHDDLEQEQEDDQLSCKEELITSIFDLFQKIEVDQQDQEVN